ncbi:hypothetical protein BDZ94DRAFT_1334159 [Collybia nuda]|uniref:Uncharacterized protein n=1 Tax=Collybia nuda TaxID=64659 RepID=A0A9P5XV61_9AGAR|nr:hypothetical protein BDZ94DRAFT_1334159 [Collybia nuda]
MARDKVSTVMECQVQTIANKAGYHHYIACHKLPLSESAVMKCLDIGQRLIREGIGTMLSGQMRPKLRQGRGQVVRECLTCLVRNFYPKT